MRRPGSMPERRQGKSVEREAVIGIGGLIGEYPRALSGVSMGIRTLSLPVCFLARLRKQSHLLSTPRSGRPPRVGQGNESNKITIHTFARLPGIGSIWVELEVYLCARRERLNMVHPTLLTVLFVALIAAVLFVTWKLKIWDLVNRIERPSPKTVKKMNYRS